MFYELTESLDNHKWVHNLTLLCIYLHPHVSEFPSPFFSVNLTGIRRWDLSRAKVRGRVLDLSHVCNSRSYPAPDMQRFIVIFATFSLHRGTCC